MAKRTRKPKPEALDETPNAVLITYDKEGKEQRWPYRKRELPQVFKDMPMRLAVHGWLQRVTFDELVELWWEAQGQRPG